MKWYSPIFTIPIALMIFLFVGWSFYEYKSLDFRKPPPQAVNSIRPIHSSSPVPIYSVLPSTPPAAANHVSQSEKEWKTYRDEKYKFAFKYPSSWKIIDLEVGKSYNDPTVLLEAVVETEDNPLNRAGHIFLLDLPYKTVIEQFVGEDRNIQSIDVTDFLSIGFHGKQYKLVYHKGEEDNRQQTDYGYILNLDNKYTLSVVFRSFNAAEKTMTPKLLEDIDTFMKTFSR